MSKSSRFKSKGRSIGNSFVAIPHFVLRSPQWGEMDAYAMKLLFELAAQYRGNNNGDLSATVEMLKGRCNSWSSKSTLPKKLRHLEDRGWIIKTRQGGRHFGCNLYAITWWPIDECNGKHHHPASNKPLHLWKQFKTSTPNSEIATPSNGD